MKPYFPKSHGVPRVDDLRVISGIIHVLKIGLQWRDAPREYCPHKTLYNRFIRWSEMGVFNKISLTLQFVISLIAFAIQDNLGDPTRELVGLSVAMEDREALKTQFGLNDPFLVQYMRFITGALQGDFGTSYFFKKPALDVILEKLPATLELVISSTLLITILSVPFVIYNALNPKKILTKIKNINKNHYVCKYYWT